MMSLSVYFNLILIFYHKIEIKEYVKSGAATFSGEKRLCILYLIVFLIF